jgi:hypothetical protein
MRCLVNKANVAVCVVLVILLGGCGAPVKTLRSLQGIVRDSTSQAPQAHIRVFAISVKGHKPYLTYTDEDGWYSFNELPSGRYVIGFISPMRRQLEGVFVEVSDCCTLTMDCLMGTSPPPGDVHQLLQQIKPEVLESEDMTR